MVNTASKLKDTTLDFGFVQVPVAVFGASQEDSLKTVTLCHGKKARMSIRCAEGGEEYTSWNKLPQRGYEWAKGEYIVLEPDEIEGAKASREAVDTMKVVKVVDAAKVDAAYVYDGAYRVMPQEEKATQTTLQSYRSIYEIVRESDRPILVRFAPRDKVRHYALVADPDGTLWACQLTDRKDKPYDVPQVTPDPKVKAQAKMLLESLASDDPTFEPEPDPLFELVQRKVEARGSLAGIGQTIPVAVAK